jgi:hypothetical protein
MQYSEIVEKLRKHTPVSAREITGRQLIMLLQDKEIKEIAYCGNVFEVNFIQITYTFMPSCVLKEDDLPTFLDGERIIRQWVHYYEEKKSFYMQIEDEYFEVVLDLLESAK